MARSPGAVGMLDIRSAGILQDVMYASNPCAPGIARWRKMKHTLCEKSIREFQAQRVRPNVKRMRNFDRPKDWVAVLASIFIVATILGIMQSYAVFIPSHVFIYKLGIVDCVMTGAGSYGLLVMLTPLSTMLVRCLGYRITCMLGILLFFAGILLLTLKIHIATFYIAYLLLMPVGGSFAYTAALTSVAGRFRRHILFALILMSFSSPAGTAGAYGILTLIFTYIEKNTYQWAMIVLGCIVLCSLLATFAFPARVAKTRAHKAVSRRRRRRKLPSRQKMPDCMDRATRRECIPTAAQPQPKSCVCVVMIDVSILSDLSFLLWGCITSFAFLTLFVPYMFLLFFGAYSGNSPDPPALLMLAVCIGSAIGRILLMMCCDHRFKFNRIIFQLCLLASGFTYLSFSWADTTGWVIMWGGTCGFLEGMFVIVIPRVTLQTIPRKWIASSWVYVIIFSGFGIIIGTAIVLSVWISTRKHALGLGTLGAGQILSAILAFLLPNEEPDVHDPKHCKNGRAAWRIHGFSDSIWDSGGRSRSSPSFSRADFYGSGAQSKYDSCLYSYGSASRSQRQRSESCANPYLGRSDLISATSYVTACPICSQFGCISGCATCTPGGLTSSVTANDSAAATAPDATDQC